MESIKPYRIFYYFTTWSVIILLIHSYYPNTIFVEEEVNNLIRFVFIGSVILNVYYLFYYSFVENLIRIPFEIIFHILPFYYVIHNLSYDNTQISLIVKLCLIYLIFVDSDTIYNAYSDPLAFIKS